MDNNEASRKAFEIDAKPYGYLLEKAKCSCCTYADDATEYRWQGWQAAQQQSAGEITELKAKIEYFETVRSQDKSLVIEAMQLKAENEKLEISLTSLREALEGAIKSMKDNTPYYSIERGHLPLINAEQALSATTSLSLQAHDDEVIERCAKVCDEQAHEPEYYEGALYCAEEIRALKGK